MPLDTSVPRTDARPTRPLCAVCELPMRTCLCGLVVRVDNRVDVLVLQHPREAREAKGSARLLRLSLARCRVVVGELFDPARLAELLHAPGRSSVLLYPADAGGHDQGDGDGHALAAPAGASAGCAATPAQLVVLDATWRKSLRMLMAHPALQALPRLGLEPARSGRYGVLRKARLPTQLSTLEATCAGLAALEGDAGRYAPLLGAFGRFVDARAAQAAGHGEHGAADVSAP